MRLEGWARARPWKAGILPIDRCWAWSNMPIFISEEDHPEASRKRNWTGEDGSREPRQKAGAEIREQKCGRGGGVLFEAFRKQSW